jgi:hypothetical protein
MAGRWVFAPTVLNIDGNSDFIFDGTALRMALSLIPLKTLMWREITPEVEPPLGS